MAIAPAYGPRQPGVGVTTEANGADLLAAMPSLTTTGLIQTHAPRVFNLFADGELSLEQAVDRLCGPRGSQRLRTITNIALQLYHNQETAMTAREEEHEAASRKVDELDKKLRVDRAELEIWRKFGLHYAPHLNRVLGQLMLALCEPASQPHVRLEETEDGGKTGVVAVETRIGMATLAFRFIPDSHYPISFSDDLERRWVLNLEIDDRRKPTNSGKRYGYTLLGATPMLGSDIDELARSFRGAQDPVLDPLRVIFVDQGDQTGAMCADLRRRLAATPTGGVIRERLAADATWDCYLDGALVTLATSMGVVLVPLVQALLASSGVLDINALAGLISSLGATRRPYDTKNL